MPPSDRAINPVVPAWAGPRRGCRREENNPCLERVKRSASLCAIWIACVGATFLDSYDLRTAMTFVMGEKMVEPIFAGHQHLAVYVSWLFAFLPNVFLTWVIIRLSKTPHVHGDGCQSSESQHGWSENLTDFVTILLPFLCLGYGVAVDTFKELAIPAIVSRIPSFVIALFQGYAAFLLHHEFADETAHEHGQGSTSNPFKHLWNLIYGLMKMLMSDGCSYRTYLKMGIFFGHLGSAIFIANTFNKSINNTRNYQFIPYLLLAPLIVIFEGNTEVRAVEQSKKNNSFSIMQCVKKHGGCKTFFSLFSGFLHSLPNTLGVCQLFNFIFTKAGVLDHDNEQLMHVVLFVGCLVGIGWPNAFGFFQLVVNNAGSEIAGESSAAVLLATSLMMDNGAESAQSEPAAALSSASSAPGDEDLRCKVCT